MSDASGPSKKAPTKSAKKAAEVPEGQKVCKHCRNNFTIAEHATHSKECLRDKQAKAQEKKAAKEAASQEKEAKKAAKARKAQEKEALAAAKAEGGPRPGATKTLPGQSAAKPSEQPTLVSVPARKTLPEPPRVKAEGTPVPGGDGPAKKTNSKKRKAEKTAPGDPAAVPKAKKKKSEEPKKSAKPKGPVDVEKQCGVELPNGLRCARSLTCKSHSMGAKRAVHGRTLPYDMLLAAYNKKNQAKLQRLAVEGNAPTTETESGEPVDSDEEVGLLMGAVSKFGGRPCFGSVSDNLTFAGGWNAGVGGGHNFVPIRRRYQMMRLKEACANAFGSQMSSSTTPFGPPLSASLRRTPQSAGGPATASTFRESSQDILPPPTPKSAGGMSRGEPSQRASVQAQSRAESLARELSQTAREREGSQIYGAQAEISTSMTAAQRAVQSAQRHRESMTPLSAGGIEAMPAVFVNG